MIVSQQILRDYLMQRPSSAVRNASTLRTASGPGRLYRTLVMIQPTMVMLQPTMVMLQPYGDDINQQAPSQRFSEVVVGDVFPQCT